MSILEEHICVTFSVIEIYTSVFVMVAKRPVPVYVILSASLLSASFLHYLSIRSLVEVEDTHFPTQYIFPYWTSPLAQNHINSQAWRERECRECRLTLLFFPWWAAGGSELLKLRMLLLFTSLALERVL